MLISDIKGLKYPDEHVIRFFFKEQLQFASGKVLELGCGNGNNLSMFYQYGWEVHGVDILKPSIDDALHNIKSIKSEFGSGKKYLFTADNMVNYLSTTRLNEFDALLLPGSLYYLNASDINTVLALLAEKRILKKGGLFFFKMRLVDDYRYGKGEQIGDNSFVLDISETGEYGVINTFYTEEQFTEIVRKLFKPDKLRISPVWYINYQNGIGVGNSELIVWGYSGV